MKENKEWFQTKEILGLGGLPSTTQGVVGRANKEGWKKRKAVGVKGRAFEYHISSFPEHIQILLNQSDVQNESSIDRCGSADEEFEISDVTRRLIQLKGDRSIEQLSKDWHMIIDEVDNYINRGVIPRIDVAEKISILDDCSFLWLVSGDNSKDTTLSLDQDVLVDAIHAVDLIVDNENVEMDLEYKAYCIAMIYELSMRPEMTREIVLSELIQRVASGGKPKNIKAV